MALYAIVRNGQVVERREVAAGVQVATRKLDTDGGPIARPLIVVNSEPAINSVTHTVARVWTVALDQVTEEWVVSAKPLAEVKSTLKARIDSDAERERMRWITPGAGQALEYEQVVREIAAFDAGSQDPMPMLQASVDSGESVDIAAAVALVKSRQGAWTAIGSTIRRVRLATKLAIDAAVSVDAAWAAYQSAAWPG